MINNYNVLDNKAHSIRLKVLDTMLGRPGASAQDFRNEINNIEDKVGNLKAMVAREPFSGHEINTNSNLNR